jgi:hypothetical protein
MAIKKLPGLKAAAAMPATERQARTAELQRQLPAAAVKRGGGEGKALQVVLPPETIKDIKRVMFEDDTTMRVVILRALKAAGIFVPPGEVIDRRKE